MHVNARLEPCGKARLLLIISIVLELGPSPDNFYLTEALVGCIYIRKLTLFFRDGRYLAERALFFFLLKNASRDTTPRRTWSPIDIYQVLMVALR